MISSLGRRASDCSAISVSDANNEIQEVLYLLIGFGRYFCASRMSVAVSFGGGGGGGGCGVAPLVPIFGGGMMGANC